MESASSEHQSEQPPGHMANLVGIVIAAITLTLPLYVVANFNDSQANDSTAVLLESSQANGKVDEPDRGVKWVDNVSKWVW